jgi:rhamnosyltransferase
MIDISVVILTKNAGKRFKKLMQSISNQNFSGRFEVIVIDSGSSDNTLDIAETYGARIFKIKPGEFHHAKTRNLGAKLAEGRYLIYITQDALPLNNMLLTNLILHLDKDPNVAGVYGRQIAYPNAKPMEKFFYKYFYPNKERIITQRDLSNLTEFYLTHTYISNVCSAIRKNIWKQIMFNESIIMAEDKKWAIDVLRAGYTLVYEPKAMVYHSHEYSFLSAFKRRFYDGVAMKQIIGKSLVKIAYSNYLRNYLIPEFKFFYKNHKKWIPYAFIYEILKISGFVFGIKC